MAKNLFASKNTDESIDLLSILEKVERNVRESKLYEILPKLDGIFDLLDGGAIRNLPDRTKKYIKNALDDIADHCTKPEISFLDFIIDRITHAAYVQRNDFKGFNLRIPFIFHSSFHLFISFGMVLIKG